MARPAASRTARSGWESRSKARLNVSSSPATGMRKPAIVSSNRRIQLKGPVTSFSCKSRSNSSESKCGRKRRIVQLIELQGKKQQPAADRGRPLGNRLIKSAVEGVGRIAREQQLRIRGKPRQPLFDSFIFGNRRGEFLRPKRGEMSSIGVCKGFGGSLRPLKIGRDFRAFRAGIEVGQIPLGQRLCGGGLPFRSTKGQPREILHRANLVFKKSASCM